MALNAPVRPWKRWWILAPCSVRSPNVLESLGITPFRRMRVNFANGASDYSPMGEVEAELNGQRMPILCFFGKTGVPALLGAHALEAFLLMVDPVDRKLIEREAFLM